MSQKICRQKKWVKSIRPRGSMLKFRLSWKPGKTVYLSGDVYLPIWGPITTSESRLIVSEDIKEKEYDNTEYEDQMFFFNTHYRVGRSIHNVEGEGIDHCFDCASEVSVLKNYLLSPFNTQPTNDIWKEISKMSYSISRKISGDRTLASPNPDPAVRRKGIVSRQH